MYICKRLAWLVVLFAALNGAAQSSSNLADGFAADKMYQFGNVDAINLFNGNLIINIPIGPAYQVSDGLSYQFHLTYNGNVWDTTQRCIEFGVPPEYICKQLGFPSRVANAGLGFLLTPGEILGPQTEWNATQDWLYVSPDGARTVVGPYGSSGSRFIRMRDVGAFKEIDFPDGTTHQFELDGNHWRLREMRDRYSTATTNFVRVSYTTWGEAPAEHGTEADFVDSFGRTQKIRYIDGFADPSLPAGFSGFLSDDGGSTRSHFEYPPVRRDTVRYVILAGPEGTTETYTFDYSVVTDGLRARHNDNEIPGQAQFRVLRSLTLPDGSKYAFTKTNGDVAYDSLGKLLTFQLPTGGRLIYKYLDRTFFPFPPQYREGQALYVIPPDVSSYVSSRELVDSVPNPGCVPESTCPTWKYTQSDAGDYQCLIDPNGLVQCPALEMKITVEDPLGNKTENFFSVARSSGYRRYAGNTLPSDEGWRDGQYGLPFTHLQPSAGGKFLSTRVYDAAGTLVRSTYVKYDSDDPNFWFQAKDLESYHPRVVGSRTVYEDDTSCGGPCYVDTESDPATYDGFGHYRRTTTTSNFGATRETFTNYNSSPTPTDRSGKRNNVFAIQPGDPWIINLYDQQSVTEGGRTAYQRVCFDLATGRLLRSRTMFGSTPQQSDLVSATEYDPRGNVSRESYYGGDGPVHAPGDLCGFDPATTTPQYAIRHKSPLGIREESYYIVPGSDDTKLLSLYDVDLDPSTGLPVKSRDAAGLETELKYKPMGRVWRVFPPNAAWTEYIYNNAGDPGFLYASVIVRQHGVSQFFEDPILSENQVEYDGFGRIYQETSTMPGGVQSVRRTKYNLNGWKVSVSERGADPTAHLTVFSNFDAFGRAGTVTGPDGKPTTIAYTGASKIARTIGVAMVEDQDDTPVTTTESYDAYGRLTGVTEPSGTQSNPSNPASANVTTTYTYDVGGHLATVDTTDTTDGAQHQGRTFNYDLRGFLKDETNPEKTGTTYYHGYDARGHLLRKQESTSSKYDLTYTYDKTERMTKIESAADGVIKEFFFDSVEDGVKSLSGAGRLLKDVRHNRNAFGDITVTNYYGYDTSGRVASKETRLSTGPVFTQNFTYFSNGQPDKLHYPTCAGCGTATKSDRQIPLIYNYGYLTVVGGFGGMTYWPNGMINTVLHTGRTPLQNTLDTQDADLSGMPRPRSIEFAGYCAGPVIGLQAPVVKTVVSGMPVDFTVTAPAGSQYQWYKGARGVTTNLLSGQTSATLHISSLTEAATYWVRVTGSDGCSSDSDIVTATLRICDPSVLVVQQQPLSTVVAAGHPFSLSVAVSDSHATYQWYRGLSGVTSNPMTDVTNATMSLPGITATTSYWVRVKGEDGCTVDSTTATVGVCTSAAITTEPPDQSGPLPAGDASTTLTTFAGATGYNLQYQWTEKIVTNNTTSWIALGNGASAIGPDLTVIFGSTGTRKRTFKVSVTSGTSATDCQGAATSREVTMQVTECMSLFSGGGGEYIVTPQYGIIPLGVYMNGHGPFEYQWYHGINGQSFTAGTTQVIDAAVFGEYDAFWCVVKDNDPNCPGATLTTPKSYIRRWDKCPLPPVTVIPDHATVTQQAPEVTLAAVEEWPNVTYQWYRGQSGDTTSPNVLLQGQTYKTLTIVPVTAATYWVRVTNSCGAHVDSPAVPVSAPGCDPIVINTQPAPSFDITSGDAVTIATDASSVQGITYKWYDSANVFQGGGPSLTAHPTVTTTYYAKIENSCTTVETFRSTVHVKACPALSIANQPQPVFFPAGFNGAMDMTVTTSPAGAATGYQWYNGTTGETAHLILNETQNTLHVTAEGNYWVRVFGAACTMDSNTAAAKRCVVPSFTSQHPGGSVRQGALVHFDATVVTAGTDLTFKWHKGPANETDNIISELPDFWFSPDDTVTYYLELLNPCGDRIVSGPIVLTVCNTPGITEQPHSIAVFPGKTTQLHVGANEVKHTDIGYQWMDELGTPVGTSSAYFTTPPITATKKYTVHVQAGVCGVDSEEATVSLCALPEVMATGTTLYIKPQEAVTLSVGTNAYSEYSFQWYRGEVGDTSNPVGTNNYQYVPPPTGTTYVYWAKVTNPADACASHTTAYTVNVCVPKITQQPANVTLNPSDPSVALSVTASPATAYKWYIGEKGDISQPVPNGTTQTINVHPSADTRYWVQVIGSCGLDSRGEPIGKTDSESALVTVCQPPAIAQTIPNQSIVRGASTTISVNATGSNLTYQWYTGASGDTSAPINNATGATVTISPQNTTNYWVRISGSCGAVNSATVTVSVCVTPSITTGPQSVSIYSGSTTTLSVTATEATTSAVSYQWYRGAGGDTSNPVGTNAATFTTPALTTQTQYWVRVSCGVCNPADSAAATVSICPFPQTINPPANVQASTQQTTRLTATSGGENYRWYSGASGNTSTPVSDWQPMTYVDVRPLVTTQYWYQVQNGSCMSNSGAMTINVCIPTITTQPASSMIDPGQSKVLTVAADTANQTYQWYTGTAGNTSNPITNATGSSYTATPSATTNYWVRVTGSCGQSVNSNTATITVCDPPSNPQITPGVWIARGQSWTLGVTVTGTNLTYQWYAGAAGNTSSPVSSGTNANVTVSPQNTTSYWVRVTGTCGTKDSTASTISVCMTPNITSSPQSVSIFSGSTTTLSVTATQGTTSPMSYQWFRGASGDTSVPVGTNSSTFTTPALTSDTNYWVRVSCGTCNAADSTTATVSICANPQIVSTSGDVQTYPTQTVRLYAYGAGNGNSYTWYKGAVNDTSQPVLTSVPQNYVDVFPSSTTTYWASIANGACVSRTNAITVNVCVPQFTQHPASTTISPGASTTLTASANTAGVTYQWYVGNSGTTTSPIPNATGASTTVTPSATTTYWVRAISSCGRTADSNPATVTICSPPNITAQPPTVNEINPPYTETISVQATGSGLTYQWYVGEKGVTTNPIQGQTSNVLTYYLTQTTRVWVRITGQCGTADSNATWLNCVPRILGQPQDLSVSYGSAATVSIAVSGTQLHYQWRNYDTNAAIGGDANRVTLPSVTSTTRVYCQVTSGSATVNSAPGQITNCDGPTVTVSTSNNGPSCRWITATINGNYTDIEWYQGQSGDTTSFYSSGQTTLMICPTTTKSFWCRVYGTDPNTSSNCNADSQTVTISP